MNVNLLDPEASGLAVGEIDNHIISMATAGYAVTGEHALVPEGRDYPGSYQVWLHANGHTYAGWIYVDTAGVVMYREYPGQKEGVFPK